MIIIFGERMLGKVDQVPGFCYVVTKFAHLNYIPLIPTASWIVLEGSESGDGFRGKPIGMSGKSVLAGYIRGWGGIAAVVTSAVVGGVVGSTFEPGLGMFVGGAVAGILALLACLLQSWYWVLAQFPLHITSIVVWILCLLGVVASRGMEAFQIVLLLANLALVLFSLSRLMYKASPERAKVLAEELGLDPNAAEEMFGQRQLDDEEQAPTNRQLEDEWEDRRRRNDDDRRDTRWDDEPQPSPRKARRVDADDDR